eukprot:687658-Amorphochlora_amoeboformis.AAC.1
MRGERERDAEKREGGSVLESERERGKEREDREREKVGRVRKKEETSRNFCCSVALIEEHDLMVKLRTV